MRRRLTHEADAVARRGCAYDAGCRVTEMLRHTRRFLRIDHREPTFRGKGAFLRLGWDHYETGVREAIPRRLQWGTVLSFTLHDGADVPRC